MHSAAWQILQRRGMAWTYAEGVMKRKIQYLFAGQGGKPVYVYGYLTDEGSSLPGRLMLEIVRTDPEPRPKPGLYAASDLPGGWLRLMPEEQQTQESDQGIVAAAREAGFSIIDRP